MASCFTHLIWHSRAISTIPFDFAFTSPPYLNIEKYAIGDQSLQARSKYKNVEDFNKRFLLETFKNFFARLNFNGVYVLNLPQKNRNLGILFDKLPQRYLIKTMLYNLDSSCKDPSKFEIIYFFQKTYDSPSRAICSAETTKVKQEKIQAAEKTNESPKNLKHTSSSTSSKCLLGTQRRKPNGNVKVTITYKSMKPLVLSDRNAAQKPSYILILKNRKRSNVYKEVSSQSKSISSTMLSLSLAEKNKKTKQPSTTNVQRSSLTYSL